MKLTPLHLKILLHAYTTPEPWPNQSQASKDYQDELAVVGLIEPSPDNSHWTCTGKGEAHIAQLLRLAFPSKAWVSKDGEIISMEHWQLGTNSN